MASMAACFIYLIFLVFGVEGLRCFEGWHNNSDTCYGYSDTALSWLEAAKMCTLYNGHLAQIETAEENVFIKTFLKYKQATKVWLGATDMFNEGDWVWFESQEYLYPFSDWYTGQPSSAVATSIEDCLAAYSTYNFQWVDDPCSSAYNFICETRHKVE